MFTDDYIGIAGDTNIIRLTSTGSVATALLDGKLDVTDDVRIGDTSLRSSLSTRARQHGYQRDP